MLFRIWYRAGQLALLGFVITAAGVMFNRTSFLLPIGVSIIVPLSICGSVLALFVFVIGLRTACPQCGTPACWVSPSKSVIAVDCEQCGLVGGNPAWDLKPRFLHEYYEPDVDDENDERMK